VSHTVKTVLQNEKEQLQQMFNEMLNRKLNESWEKPWFVPVNKNSAVTNYKDRPPVQKREFYFFFFSLQCLKVSAPFSYDFLNRA